MIDFDLIPIVNFADLTDEAADWFEHNNDVDKGGQTLIWLEEDDYTSPFGKWLSENGVNLLPSSDVIEIPDGIWVIVLG